jgi:hypothetical protein
VIYPQKYIGDAPIQLVALDLQDFTALNPGGCGSDNLTLIDLIKGVLIEWLRRRLKQYFNKRYRFKHYHHLLSV